MTPEEIKAMILAELKPVKETVDKFGAQFPDMSKRHATEAAETLKAALLPAIEALKPKADPPKPTIDKPKDPDVAAALGEVEKLKDQIKAEKKNTAIMAALGSVRFVKGVSVAEEAERLSKRVEFAEDGKLVFKSSKYLELEKKEIPENVDVAEGVKREYANRKYMIEAENAGGGSGAQGTNGVKRFATVPTAEQLERDPERAAQFVKEHPEDYDRIMAEDLQKTGKGRI